PVRVEGLAGQGARRGGRGEDRVVRLLVRGGGRVEREGEGVPERHAPRRARPVVREAAPGGEGRPCVGRGGLRGGGREGDAGRRGLRRRGQGQGRAPGQDRREGARGGAAVG